MFIDWLARWLVNDKHEYSKTLYTSPLTKENLSKKNTITKPSLDVYDKLTLHSKPQINNTFEDIYLNISATKMPKELVSLDMDNFKELTMKVEEASRRIQESEQLYQTTINSISDWIHVIDKDYKVLLMNDAILNSTKEFGILKNQSPIGKKLTEVFPFLDKKVFDEYEYVFKNGKNIETEETININGVRHVTTTKKCPVFYNSEVIRIVTTIRDITEKVEADEKIQKERELWETTFNSTLSLIMILDHDKNIIQINKSFLDQTNKNKEDLVGKKCSKILFDSDECCQKCFSPEVKDGKSFTCELNTEYLKGIYIISSTIIKMDDNKDYGYVILLKDITKIHNLELALKRKESFIENISNCIQEYIVRFDKEYMVTFINDAFCSKLNKRKEDISNKNIQEIFKDEGGFYIHLLESIKNVSKSREVTNSIITYTDEYNDKYTLSLKSTYNGCETPIEYYCILKKIL